MKRLFVLSMVLFSVSLFAQSTIDFDTTGQSYAWTVFANGTGDPSDFGVIPNPNPSGINTSANVVKFKVNADAAVFAGAFTDNVSFTVTAENSKPSIMFHKDVISDCAFKFEGPGGYSKEIKVPNTVTGQWEKLTFDFSTEIGQTVTRIVVFPDFPATRTAGSMNYFDNIEFVPTTAPARVQIIHNSADILAGAVDIYVNGTLALDNFAFRAATPFIDLPSVVTLNIGVAQDNSTSVADTIKNFPVVLAEGEKYVVFANGVLTAGYAANPDGRNTNFTLFVKPAARETGLGTDVDLFVLHGSTDAPTVDVKAREASNATLVNDAAYGDITPYFSVPPANYTLDLYLADGTTLVNSFIAPLAGLGGGSATVFASGFLNPAVNQNGAGFGLFAALANGDVIELLPGVVPVELTSFSALTNGTSVNLSWSTATETNNYGFEVQRKSLNGNFATIAFVKGNGTTSQKSDYTFSQNNLEEGKYYYRLKQIDFDGKFDYSKTVEVDIRLLSNFSLEQNYPNPFNPTTTIGYVLQEKSNVKLTLMNLLGEELSVLVNEVKEKGYHKIDFNANNLPSGVYLYRIQAGNFVNTKKMTLMK